jgi:hypothetical protein
MDPTSLLIVALDALGQEEQARRWGEPLLKAATSVIRNDGNSVRRHMLESMVATQQGDQKAGMAALEAAYKVGYRDRWQLLYDPRLAPLQKFPELQAMQQRMAEEFSAAREELSRTQTD